MADETEQAGGDALATEKNRSHSLQEQLDATSAENDQLKTKLAAAEKRADEAEAKLAKAKAPATAKPTKPRARKVAAMDPADRDSLRALLQWSGPFEVVPAHDGKEVTTLNPVEVNGDAFVYSGGLHKLTAPVSYTPDEASTVDGFGLFGTDGKQVAYAPLPEPVDIAPRQTMSFADAIGFPSRQAEG